jgi:hypothetical protein
MLYLWDNLSSRHIRVDNPDKDLLDILGGMYKFRSDIEHWDRMEMDYMGHHELVLELKGYYFRTLEYD